MQITLAVIFLCLRWNMGSQRFGIFCWGLRRTIILDFNRLSIASALVSGGRAGGRVWMLAWKLHESGWPRNMKVGGPTTHFHACADIQVPKCGSLACMCFGCQLYLTNSKWRVGGLLIFTWLRELEGCYFTLQCESWRVVYFCLMIFQCSLLLAGLYESHVYTERMGERGKGERGERKECGLLTDSCRKWHAVVITGSDTQRVTSWSCPRYGVPNF